MLRYYVTLFYIILHLRYAFTLFYIVLHCVALCYAIVIMSLCHYVMSLCHINILQITCIWQGCIFTCVKIICIHGSVLCGKYTLQLHLAY